jgi:hypothetical protein
VKYTDLRCARCDATAEPSVSSAFSSPADETIPPNDALLFLSYGNYGSRMFDSADSSQYLLILICDNCAGELRDAGNVMLVTKERPAVTRQRHVQEPWRPGEAAP